MFLICFNASIMNAPCPIPLKHLARIVNFGGNQGLSCALQCRLGREVWAKFGMPDRLICARVTMRIACLQA